MVFISYVITCNSTIAAPVTVHYTVYANGQSGIDKRCAVHKSACANELVGFKSSGDMRILPYEVQIYP